MFSFLTLHLLLSLLISDSPSLCHPTLSPHPAFLAPPARLPEEPSAKLQTQVEGVSHAGTIPHSFGRLAWAAPSPVAPFFLLFWRPILRFSPSPRSSVCVLGSVMMVQFVNGQKLVLREVLVVVASSLACWKLWSVVFHDLKTAIIYVSFA